jgi:hypothetical protein
MLSPTACPHFSQDACHAPQGAPRARKTFGAKENFRAWENPRVAAQIARPFGVNHADTIKWMMRTAHAGKSNTWQRRREKAL